MFLFINYAACAAVKKLINISHRRCHYRPAPTAEAAHLLPKVAQLFAVCAPLPAVQIRAADGSDKQSWRGRIVVQQPRAALF